MLGLTALRRTDSLIGKADQGAILTVSHSVRVVVQINTKLITL